MRDIVVIGFDGEDQARAALASLRGIEKRGGIAFEDTAIVACDAEGRTRVRNEVSGTTETGAVVGGLVGGLLFLLFPVLGIAVGAAAGAGIGAVLGKGVDRDFVKDVQASLTPGTSALFLVIRRGDPDMVVAALRPFHGRVIQTTLDDELEAGLRAALDG